MELFPSTDSFLFYSTRVYSQQSWDDHDDDNNKVIDRRDRDGVSVTEIRKCRSSAASSSNTVAYLYTMDDWILCVDCGWMDDVPLWQRDTDCNVVICSLCDFLYIFHSRG